MFAEETLKTAATSIRKIAGVDIRLAGLAMVVRETDPEQQDIEISVGQFNNYFAAETRGELRDIHLPKILAAYARDKDAREGQLLICRYIPAPIKEELKKNGINYLETSGNCFIKKDAFFLFINDQKVTPQRATKEGKLWSAPGIKFLFAALTEQDLLHKTQREIAEKAGIALGSVGTLINELEQEGFLNDKHDLITHRKTELINRWVELYTVILRPKLKLGTYKSPDAAGWNSKWKQILANTTKEEGLIYAGGEPAGNVLTRQLQPEKFILYTGSDEKTTLKTLRLIPDKGGNIELRKAFWPASVIPGNGTPPVVHPLLAYADLIASMDSRNIEIAQKIKLDHLL